IRGQVPLLAARLGRVDHRHTEAVHPRRASRSARVAGVARITRVVRAARILGKVPGAAHRDDHHAGDAVPRIVRVAVGGDPDVAAALGLAEEVGDERVGRPARDALEDAAEGARVIADGNLEGGGALVAAIPGDAHALEGADAAEVELEVAAPGAGPAGGAARVEDVLGTVAVVCAGRHPDDLDRTRIAPAGTALATVLAARTALAAGARILPRGEQHLDLRDAVPRVVRVAVGGDAHVAGAPRSEGVGLEIARAAARPAGVRLGEAAAVGAHQDSEGDRPLVSAVPGDARPRD